MHWLRHWTLIQFGPNMKKRLTNLIGLNLRLYLIICFALTIPNHNNEDKNEPHFPKNEVLYYF